MHNPDDPELDDEDLLNRRIVIARFNTDLLRQFGARALSKVLGLSEETVRKNVMQGFPLSDETVSRLRGAIEVGAGGQLRVVKPVPTAAETKRCLKMQRQLLVIRRSLSSKGKLASIDAVVEVVLKHVTPEIAALAKDKSRANVETITRGLRSAIPMMLNGEVFPNVKLMPAMERTVRVASGAAAMAEKLAKLNEWEG